MPKMSKAEYQNIAKALLREGKRIEALKDRWAEERHGEHELTSLQSTSLFSARMVLNNVTEDIIESFSNLYSDFNEEKFRQSVKVV